MSYISYVASLVGILAVIARANGSGFAFYFRLIIIEIIILLLIQISSMLSYYVFYNEGVHNITQQNKEITTTEGGLMKFMGAGFVLPIIILAPLRLLILGDNWIDDPLDTLHALLMVFVLIILAVIDIRIYTNHKARIQ